MIPDNPGTGTAEDAAVPATVPLKRSVFRSRFGPRKAPAPDNGNEIWFLTLSDLLLLLVIFFVLLFGLSWQQQQPQPRIALEPAAAAAPTHPAELAPPPPPADLEKDLAESLEMAGASGVTLEQRGPALVLTFPERIVFDSGEARVKAEADPILASVGTIIQGRPELLVEVQGHTDDRPIRNARYPSNWELSADRATQVARSLIHRGASPRQISVKGFGEFQALAPNDSEINRLKNRRVEILFFRQPG